MDKIELGVQVKDVVSGFQGWVTGRVEYLTGCRRYLVQPNAAPDKYVEPCWIDEDRLKVLGADKIELPKTISGFGESAPAK